MQYAVVGFPEFQNIPALLNSGFSGPAILTGSPVGLEASILTFILCLSLGIYLLKRAYKQGLIIHFIRQG